MIFKAKKKTIRILGLADRIDKKGDEFRILDYKSGKSDKTKLVFKKELGEKEMNNILQKPEFRYARQLLMYAIMFRQFKKEATKFSAGIISMVNISDWIQSLTYKGRYNH